MKSILKKLEFFMMRRYGFAIFIFLIGSINIPLFSNIANVFSFVFVTILAIFSAMICYKHNKTMAKYDK